MQESASPLVVGDIQGPARALTPRERFIAALERRPQSGLVPHFELVFFLTMESLGMLHPSHRHFTQWSQMSEHERRLHRQDIARVYVAIAEKYDHGAIFLQASTLDYEETAPLLEEIRRQSGDRFYLTLHGDPTLAIPNGDGMAELCVNMANEPERVKGETEARIAKFSRVAERYRAQGCLDGFTLCSDYCFNSGPFMSLEWFDEFITPYLKQQVTNYRELGFYVIKHTDGNIMPILDRLVAAGPHAIHSLDPQGGVEIAEVARLVGDKVCLIGNVNCGLMQTGTDAEVIESASHALREGLKVPGYIFSTSNCVFPGMELRRYEMILEVWRREGIRPADWEPSA